MYLLALIKRIEMRFDVVNLFNGIIWVSVGNVISSLATLSSSLILAKSLGAELYGKYSLIQSTLAIFLVLSGPSLGFFATKHIAELQHENPKRTAALLEISTMSVSVIGGVIGAIMLISSNYIAEAIMRAPDLKLEINLCAGVVFFTSVGSAQLGIISGFKEFKMIAVLNITKGLLTFFLVVSGGYFYGITGALGGLVVVAIAVYFLGNFYISNIKDKYNLPSPLMSDTIAEIKSIFSFSLPNFLFSFVSSSANMLTYILLSRVDDGYMQLGIFNVANQYFLLLNFLPMIIWQVTFPMLANASGGNEFRIIKSAYRKLILFNILVISMLIGIAAPFARLLMMSIGKEFGAEVPTLIVTLILAYFYSASNVAWQIMLIMDKVWISFWFVVIHSCILVTSFILFESEGSYGLAIARLIAYSFYAVITIYYVEVTLKKRIKVGVA